MSDKKAELDKPNEQEQIKTQRRAAYYQALWTAWFEHRIELDKQLLTLSALAIGLLMFFHSELDSSLEKKLWLVAGGLFITTIILILVTFYISSNHIKCMLDEKDEIKERELESTLKKLMFWSSFLFILAVLTTFILAILSVFMVKFC